MQQDFAGHAGAVDDGAAHRIEREAIGFGEQVGGNVAGAGAGLAGADAAHEREIAGDDGGQGFRGLGGAEYQDNGIEPVERLDDEARVLGRSSCSWRRRVVPFCWHVTLA
ncbi:MAG: hypothetical protein WDN04_12000 [Rhodospirillales bacterium]